MPLEIVTIPCLQDNYAYIVHDAETGATAVVDVPEAAPIIAALDARGWTLSHVWLTHHHWDHVDGLGDLLAHGPAKVWGAADDAHRLPVLNHAFVDGDVADFAGHSVGVFDVSGHTLGHIAFYVADAEAVFTADSLMAMGCGRLFEGTPEQMWASLQKLMELPKTTMVYSGHEYTASNCKFALTIDRHNPRLISRSEQIAANRVAGLATVPSALEEECATNPFLRPFDAGIRETLNMTDATDAEVFTEIRKRKDTF